MNNNINLADVQAFVAIASLGSFTKAAEALSASRSHLSRQLNQLETQLGVQLLIRTTRTQRLTDAGEAFFQQCQSSLNTINQAILSSAEQNEAIRGSISINAVGGYIGEEIITPLLADFARQHPELDIQLDFSSPRVDLISEQFDLVFRMGTLEDSTIVARKLTSLTISTLASPDYLAQHPILTTPKQLKQHSCLTGSVTQWFFQQTDNEKQQQDIKVSGNFSCNNGRSLINAALAGNGIIRVPAIYCSEHLKSNALVPVFTDWQAADVPFYLLYHKNKYQPKKIKTIINYIMTNFNLYLPQL